MCWDTAGRGWAWGCWHQWGWFPAPGSVGWPGGEPRCVCSLTWWSFAMACVQFVCVKQYDLCATDNCAATLLLGQASTIRQQQQLLQVSEVGRWAADARCPGWLLQCLLSGMGYAVLCQAGGCTALPITPELEDGGCRVGCSTQSVTLAGKGMQPSFVLAPASAGQMCAPGSRAVGQRAYVGSVLRAGTPQPGQRAAPGGAGGAPQAPSTLAPAAPMPDCSPHSGQSLLQQGKQVWEKQRTREHGGHATAERPGRAERCRCWGGRGCRLAPG